MINRLALVICLVALLSGCERVLKVTLDGANPPTFKFNGSGEISWVYIYQVTPQGKIPPSDCPGLAGLQMHDERDNGALDTVKSHQE